MLDCRNVIRNLGHVVEFDGGRLVIFEQQQIRKRGLCSLDLRGKEGLLTDIHVKEQRGRRQDRRHAVQAPHRADGAFVNPHNFSEVEGRIRRQRGRHIGPNVLASCARFHIDPKPLVLCVRHT